MKAKFIKEFQNFKRNLDNPLESLGIGNILIQLSKRLNLTQEEIKKIINSLDIESKSDDEISTFEDFSFGVWAIWDDPDSFSVERDSKEYQIAKWADKNLEKAYKIYLMSKKSKS
jgi:hypothetical protein